MPVTIDPNAHVTTLINVFTVRREKQEELIELLERATKEVMQNQPGFISASIHRSFDGSRVVNYAQWRSREDFETMRKDPGASEHMKMAAAIAEFDPILCEVAFSTRP